MDHLSKWQALVVISKELLQCWIAALAGTTGMGVRPDAGPIR